MDVSVVINAHKEGLLAYPALKSVLLAKERAQKESVQVEVIAVLDSADSLTTQVFDRLFSEITIVHVNVRDLGSARNAGVEKARGKYVAFLDADDMFNEDWLLYAYRAAEKDPRKVIWHPHVNLYFGSSERVFVHVDMESKSYNHLNLLVSNYWTALSFARRQHYLDFPYERVNLSLQIGYEDYTWNIKMVEAGFLHKVVPNTSHAIRVKDKGSMLQAANSANCFPAPTLFFQSLIGLGDQR